MNNTNFDDNIPYLVQQETRFSRGQAEFIVDGLLKQIKINPIPLKKKGFILRNVGTDKEEKHTYKEFVQQVQKTGSCKLQYDADQKDNIYGLLLGMSTNTDLGIKLEWSGYQKALKGPFRIHPSELELSEDIEFYKEEACAESINHDFEMVSRNYRGYLLSSIALVDCYINRHILFYDNQKFKSNDFEELKKLTRVEEKIEMFTKIFCNSSFFSELKKTQIWGDFKKIKGFRNEMVHAQTPYMGVEIKELASNLNLSINGVGALLRRFQEAQGKKTLAFIERVRTSPIIKFNQRATNAKGEIVYKILDKSFKRL
jgi:hypothetical protein